MLAVLTTRAKMTCFMAKRRMGRGRICGAFLHPEPARRRAGDGKAQYNERWVFQQSGPPNEN